MARRTGAEVLSGAIKGAAMIVPLIPGVAMLATTAPLPPPADKLLGGLSLAFGVVMVIAVITVRGKIAKLKPGLAAALLLGASVVGVVFAVSYYRFGATHIIAYDNIDQNGKVESVRLIAPLRPSPALAGVLAEFNGDYGEALHSPIYHGRVAALIGQENGSATALLVTYLILAQAFLIGAVVAGAWRSAAFFEGRGAARARPAPPD